MNKAVVALCSLMILVLKSFALFDVEGLKKYGPPQQSLLEAVEVAKAMFSKEKIVECVGISAFPCGPESTSRSYYWIELYTPSNSKWVLVTDKGGEILQQGDSMFFVNNVCPSFLLPDALKIVSEKTQGVPVEARLVGSVPESLHWCVAVLAGTNLTAVLVDPCIGIVEMEYPKPSCVLSPSEECRVPDTKGDFTKLTHGGHTLSEWVNLLAEDDGVNTNKYDPRELFSLPPTNDFASLPIVLALATNDFLSFSIRTELLKAVLFENKTDRGNIDLIPFFPLIEVLLIDDAIGEEALSRKRLAFNAMFSILPATTLPLANAVIRAAQLDHRGKFRDDVDRYFESLEQHAYVPKAELKSWRRQAHPIKKPRR